LQNPAQTLPEVSSSVGEFALIARYFTQPTSHTDLGVGDDAALMSVSAGHQLVASVDALISGRHFFPDAEPWGVGWKSLAVSVSDLAAMGARPRWALLSLSLPDNDEAFVAGFSAGFMACARTFGIDLVGGDTTCGPLTVSITLLGEVLKGKAVLRSGALPGDDIWVSGQPGRAVLGLHALQGRRELPPPFLADCLGALHRPQPRLTLGQRVSEWAHAMLDISDGLLGDLGHLLSASGVCAELSEAGLPLQALMDAGELSSAQAREAVLYGGDDYELLFAASPQHRAALEALSKETGIALHCIGQCLPRPLTAVTDIVLHRKEGGAPLRCPLRGYDHFSPSVVNQAPKR
jgi:thiamine-monophosphate kinase